jgi:1,4-dihydroxy-2-naphthoate octaprenyltransferase
VLPLYGYYGQMGQTEGFPAALLAVILPTALACAMATALPDEPSDRQSEKRTAVVWLGYRRVQETIALLNLGSIVAFVSLLCHLLPLSALLWLIAMPSLATLSLPFTFGGRPGERRLSLFVGGAVTANLALLAALSALPLALD